MGVVVVVGLVGESMWKTNPVFGSAFSDQVSSSMLHIGMEYRNITILFTLKLHHVIILIIFILCENSVYYDILIIVSDSQSRSSLKMLYRYTKGKHHLKGTNLCRILSFTLP